MRILITGITGFLGSRIAEYLSQEGHSVGGLTRDEHKLVPYPPTWIGNLEHPGDVRRALDIFSPEAVIHAAALKVVPSSESDPFPYIRTNVQGTLNLLRVVPPELPFLYVSTDKAVDPFNVYGLTKALGERLVLHRPGGVVIRFGNIFGSRGSVIRVWMRQARGGYITVTDESMTRFFVQSDFAVRFLCDHLCRPGLWIPKLKAHTLGELKEAFLRVYPSVSPRFIPVRPGEKFHELLISPNELYKARDLGEEYLISPNVVGNVPAPVSSKDAFRLSPEFLESQIRDIVGESGG